MTQSVRAVFGFAAGAISVLVFHQGMWTALHLLDLPGMGMPPSFPLRAIPPFGVPAILNMCFWGGLWGALFGVLLPRLPRPLWLSGLAIGILAALVGMFIVPAIKGLPVGNGWALLSWLRSFLINGAWGVGTALILPLLLTLKGRREAYGR